MQRVLGFDFFTKSEEDVKQRSLAGKHNFFVWLKSDVNMMKVALLAFLVIFYYCI